MVSKVAVKPRGTSKLKEIINSVQQTPLDLLKDQEKNFSAESSGKKSDYIKISSLFDIDANTAMNLANDGLGDNLVMAFLLRTADSNKTEKLICRTGGKTLLMMAAKNGWIQVTKHLLNSERAKGRVTVADEYGDTCLHYAARCSAGKDYRTPILQMLINKGANPEVKNNDGKKPQEIALDMGGEDSQALVTKIMRDQLETLQAQLGNGRMVFTDLPKLKQGPPREHHVFMSHCQQTTKQTIQHIQEICKRISPNLEMWWDQVRPQSVCL